MAWTEERVELLTKLWAEGLSASQIARTLGEVTRNAVIGKVHRLGLSGRATPSRAERPRVAIRRKPVINKPVMTEPEIIEEEVLEDGAWATVMTLTERMCKWPIGHPGSKEFHFCGRSAPTSAPYCEAHVRLAYQASTSRRGPKRATQQQSPVQAERRRAAG